MNGFGARMKRRWSELVRRRHGSPRALTWGLSILALLSAVTVAWLAVSAQSGDVYTLIGWTADGGGGAAAAGGYALHHTIAQPEAVPDVPTGGGYTILTGFWGGEAAQSNGDEDGCVVYLPVAFRNYRHYVKVSP
jgi:hypothetical protein